MDEIIQILHLLQEYDNARKEYEKLLRQGGWKVTGPQLGVLRIVEANPGISISELAEKMHLHVTTAEGYAKRLLKLGYITLEEDPKDRRRKIMRSTPQGMDVLKKVPPGFKYLLVQNLSQAGAEEKEAILRGLSYLIHYLKEKR